MLGSVTRRDLARQVAYLKEENQDPQGPAAGTIGRYTAGETPVTEVRSQAGCSTVGPYFDRQLPNLRPLDSRERSLAYRRRTLHRPGNPVAPNAARDPETCAAIGLRKQPSLQLAFRPTMRSSANVAKLTQFTSPRRTVHSDFRVQIY